MLDIQNLDLTIIWTLVDIKSRVATQSLKFRVTYVRLGGRVWGTPTCFACCKV